MTATSSTAAATTLSAEAEAPVERRVPRHGWRVVAAKEFSDHLLSARFIVLTLIVGLAAIVPLYFVADRIRGLASQASGSPAIFLALFSIPASDQGYLSILQVDQFIGIVAPLLGIAFAFDAVNGERAEGTLPRLLSQPIHRDDVINGKFVAGLAVIALVVAAVLGVISAFGLIRLGVIPALSEVYRLIAWLVVTIVYVALWLAFGLLLSVVIRRAATSALIAFGVWVVVWLFGPIIVNLVQDALVPLAGVQSQGEALAALGTRQLLGWLLPSQLYADATLAILRPDVTGVATPTTLGQVEQAQQQIPTLLSLDQSLLLVWPQVVALIALTVICFAGAYVLFMRQEVRA